MAFLFQKSKRLNLYASISNAGGTCNILQNLTVVRNKRHSKTTCFVLYCYLFVSVP